MRRHLDGRRVSIKIAEPADLAFERIAHYWRMEQDPRRIDVTNVIRSIAEEAAYALEDFIDDLLQSGASEFEIYHQVRVLRFNFVACDDSGLARRGAMRESEAAAVNTLLHSQIDNRTG